MQNITASFREVGVYPTNRDHVISKLSADAQPSQERPSTTIPYVPFCTPRSQPVEVPSVPKTPAECTPLHSQQGRAEMITPEENDTSVLLMASPVPLPFTESEVQRFQKRLEEGYDVPDARYSQWLSTLPSKYRPPSSILDKILRPPTPPAQRKVGDYSRGAHVLTSEQCRQALFEKEQEKKKAAEEKEQKRRRAAELKEEKRKKAEEAKEQRRKKAEEKEEEGRRKAAEQQKKKEERERKQAEKATVTTQGRQKGTYVFCSKK